MHSSSQQVILTEISLSVSDFAATKFLCDLSAHYLCWTKRAQSLPKEKS